MIVAKRPEVRREELIDAAEELFGENGYEETKVSDIIERVGVAKGTFYYYFKSKGEILFAVAHRVWTDFEDHVSKLARDDGIDPLEKLRIIIDALVDMKSGPHSIMEALHQGKNRAVHDLLTSEGYKRMVSIITEVVEQGKKEGYFDTEHPRKAVEFLFMGSSTLNDPCFESETTDDLKALADFHDRILGAKKGTFLHIFEKIYEITSETSSDQIEGAHLD